MKDYITTWFYRVLLFAAGTIVYSCTGDPIMKEVILDNDTSVDHAFEVIGRYFAEDAPLVGIAFFPSPERGVTKNAGIIKIFSFDANKNLMCAVIPLFKGGKKFQEAPGEEDILRFRPENGVKLTEFDHSGIAGYVREAADIVREADQLYEETLLFSGVGGYLIVFDGESRNGRHYFQIESLDENQSGDGIERYYGFDFEVRDGQLISMNL